MKMSVFAAAAALCLSASAGDVVMSLQAYTFRDRPFVETVETAARLGFANIEAYPGQALGGGMEGTTDYATIPPESLRRLKEFLAAAPVKVVSYGVTGAGDDAGWEKLMAFCKTLGIGQVEIEAGLDAAYYDRAEKFAAANAVRVALHNHAQENGKPKPMRETLAGRGPWIGCGADVAHWTTAGEDALEGIRLQAGKVFEIHLGDVAPASAGGRGVPLGSGIVPVKGVLDALKEVDGTVYATIEYEHMSPALEDEVATCVRWFRAWARGEIGCCNRIPESSLGALWRDIGTANPAVWKLPAEYEEMYRTQERVKKMHRFEIDLDSVKADHPGVVQARETARQAFADTGKYCRPWQEGAFVSCALKEPGKVAFYTVGSSNDEPPRDPVKWTLYGSDDGENWTVLDSREGIRFPARFFLRGFEVQSPRVCRHLKFAVSANGGGEHLQFSRLGFFE